jgi:hypothetical protein
MKQACLFITDAEYSAVWIDYTWFNQCPIDRHLACLQLGHFSCKQCCNVDSFFCGSSTRAISTFIQNKLLQVQLLKGYVG